MTSTRGAPEVEARGPLLTTEVFEIAARTPPPSGEYQWVYLWHRPLRAMHWVATICVVALIITGLYIGKPYFMTGGEASSHYLMGWFRFVHFTSAALLVMTGIIRIYWLFAGNHFERLPALFPVRKRDLRNLVRITKFYLLIQPEKAPKYLGHNPLQQISYTIVYAMVVVMVFTGFAMYGQSNPGGFLYVTFNWVNALFGGAPIVRFTHHVLTWLILTFIPIHVYLAVRADNWERTGTISSIVSGGRFVPVGEDFVDGRP